MYKRTLCDLEKEGLLSPVNKAVANFFIFGAINWCHRWFKENGELSLEDVADTMINMVLCGILNSKEP